jgi:hypothetical protein
VAAGDLSTLANVKQWLNVTGSVDDALLARLLTSVSNFIQSWLNRTIAATVYTETLDGVGGQYLMLPNYPVTAVASLSINGTALAASASVSAPGYFFDDYGVHLRGYTFPRLPGCVDITYTAGLPSIPVEIEQACVELIALRYAGRARPGVTSRSIGGESVSFSQDGLSDAIKSTLMQYRKVAPS